MAQLTRSTFDPKVARWWWRSLRQWLYELIDPLYASFRGENSEDLTLTNVTSLNGLTASEIATLGGITATTAELNKLGGLTADAADLNKSDRSSVDGDAEASRVVVLDANKDMSGKRFDINQSQIDNVSGGQYYALNETDNISVSDDPNLQISTSLTIMVLAKSLLNNLGNEEILCGKYTAGGNQRSWALAIRSDEKMAIHLSSDGAALATVESINSIANIDRWHHYAVIFNGATQSVILYVDGKEIASSCTLGSIPSSIFTGTSPLQIGNRGDGNATTWSGEIAQALIYNRALDAVDIQHLASGMAPPAADCGASQTNLVANGDAFTGATGSTPPNSWSDSGAGTATYIIRNNTGVANMDADTLEFASSGGEKILKQSILTPGKRYRLSFAYRNFDGSAASYVYMGTSTNQAILTHTTFVGDGVLFSQEFLADGDELGFVTADGGAIQMDDVQVIPIGCVAQYEPDGIGSATWYDKSGNGLHGTVNGATAVNLPIAYVNDAGRHMVEGESGQRNIIRSARLRFQPGATPGTNINISEFEASNQAFNQPNITDGIDIAKNGSNGSFSLNASGTIVTMDISENIVGILCSAIVVHDINSSSTTEMYVALARPVSNNMTIEFNRRGSSSPVDITTILDAGDICDIMVSYITSS